VRTPERSIGWLARVNVVLGLIAAIGLSALAVVAIWYVRRGAPEGGNFADGDRAAGFFGVLATGFSILLGFIVFLAFSSYDQSRSGAESEAVTVAQQFETAQFFDDQTAATLGGQVICYGRYVVDQEWPEMRSGDIGNQVNPWAVEMYKTVLQVEPHSNAEGSAFDKWLDQTSDRESARIDRVHGAEGVMPWPLWVVLILSAALILVFVMFFADPAERAVVQAIQVGSIVLIMTTMLFVVRFLDHPYQEGVGGVQPTAMERTLDILENQVADVGSRAPLPCDSTGQPR
jgi:hypothetical protein